MDFGTASGCFVNRIYKFCINKIIKFDITACLAQMTEQSKLSQSDRMMMFRSDIKPGNGASLLSY